MGNPYSSFIERKVFSSINSTYLPQTKQNHPHYRFPGNLSETSKPIKKSRSVCMSRTFFSIILVPRDNALITGSFVRLIMGNLILTRYLTKKTRRLVATRPTRPALNHFYVIMAIRG